ASTNAQAAATTSGRRPPPSTAASRGRRPAVSTAAHLVLDPGSLDLSIRFPFEPTRLWPQVDIFARAPTTGNRLPYRFQQKDRPPERSGRVSLAPLHAFAPPVSAPRLPRTRLARPGQNRQSGLSRRKQPVFIVAMRRRSRHPAPIA